jgi:hypothetical protein
MFRVCAVGVWFCALAAQCADVSVRVSNKTLPSEISPEIAALLQPQAVQVVQGDKTLLEMWLAKEVTLQAKPSSAATALDAIKQASVLGAVAVPAARRDYRDDEVGTGAYTMRFALQPQDGNHSGSAEFPYFGVLVPAKLDTKPDGIKDYKELMKASSKETSTDHPMVMSLRPVTSLEGPAVKLSTPAPEHKSVRVKVPAKGSDTKEIAFDIVFEGKGHK